MELKEAIDTRRYDHIYWLCSGSYHKRQRSICLIHWNHIMLMEFRRNRSKCFHGFIGWPFCMCD